tara:strand:+ start:415 stop:723 length:309 start_codon:yes stop_codon:yes gene_type:complete
MENIDDILLIPKDTINIKNQPVMESTHGKIISIKKYANGKYGGVFEDGQFRWVGIETQLQPDNQSPSLPMSPANGSSVEGEDSVDLKTAVDLMRKYYFDDSN